MSNVGKKSLEKLFINYFFSLNKNLNGPIKGEKNAWVAREAKEHRKKVLNEVRNILPKRHFLQKGKTSFDRTSDGVLRAIFDSALDAQFSQNKKQF